MAWLIFFFWLIVFSWLITRIGFIKRSGLPARILIFLFITKVIAGIAYFRFHSLPEYRHRSDTWKFYDNSLAETELLKKDPFSFVSGLFTSGYENSGGLFSGENSYWNDVKDTAMIKLVAVTNVFTSGNYYTNIIFFNFLFFIGLVAFYRLVKTLFPDKKYGLLAAVFLIPSFLFWCSGIHKDGLVFSCIGLILYFFHSFLNRRRHGLSLLFILICLVVIFFLRNYIVFVLLCSLLAGWCLSLFPKRRGIVLTLLLIVGTTLFFSAKYIHPSLDLPKYIVSKQQEFRKLEGHSLVPVQELEPTFGSFVRNLPAAIDMGFFRPHPNEKGLVSLLASAEIIILWLVVLICIVYRRKTHALPSVAWSCILFSVLVLLIIGYTVPFSGAVVRYRCLVLPLLLAVAIGNLDARLNIIKKYM